MKKKAKKIGNRIEGKAAKKRLVAEVNRLRKSGLPVFMVAKKLGVSVFQIGYAKRTL